jgi:hypothetical protein
VFPCLRHFLPALALAAAVAVAACSNPVGADRVPPPDPTQVVYAPSLGIDLSQFTRTSSGLYVRDDIVGTGAVIADSDSVAVRYTGWLVNGTRFDTNEPNGTPFRFRVGAGQVIAGWDEGIVGMRVGGTRRLVIPSPLAYGPGGAPPSIPGNAVLVFRVVLVQRF